MEEDDFTGKVIAISGATRGLGRALAERMGASGARLALMSRSADRIEEVRALLPKTSGHIFFAGDVGNPADVNKFSEIVLSSCGTVDVGINNASILGPRKEIIDYPIEDWIEVFRVNLTGTLLFTKAFLPSMVKAGSGSIINISSSVGRTSRARWGAYAASKFAVEGFTQTLANEVFDKGIRVNSVNPGAMATEMRRAAFPNEDFESLPSPSDHLDVYLYLAGNRSIGVTGKAFDARTFSL